jgi:transposase
MPPSCAAARFATAIVYAWNEGVFANRPLPYYTSMSKTQTYPSDLTDAQWALIQPLLPKPYRRGRRRSLDCRRVLDAIFSLERTGCPWRQLPHDFPPWGTVARYFSRWRPDRLWLRIHHTLHAAVRRQAGKKPTPRKTPFANTL